MNIFDDFISRLSIQLDTIWRPLLPAAEHPIRRDMAGCGGAVHVYIVSPGQCAQRGGDAISPWTLNGQRGRHVRGIHRLGRTIRLIELPQQPCMQCTVDLL